MAETKRKKKWLSYTIDGLLVLIIAFLGYVQVSMMVTKNQNYGVPSVFGVSFLYVSTESMDDLENQPNGVHKGTGIIIEKVKDISKLRPSTKILDENDEFTGDYKKDGDIVTFFYKGNNGSGIVDTHRLVELTKEDDGKWHMVTMGDNPIAHTRRTTEKWTEDELIGRVTAWSQGFGEFLTITSPDAAASAGKTAWLLPVGIIVPLILLAGMSIIDVYRTAKEQEKQEEAEILAAMIAAGVDPNDETAAELFRQKEEFKREYYLKMQEEVELAKKLAKKKQKKQQKGASK